MKTEMWLSEKKFRSIQANQTEFEFDVWRKGCAPDLYGEVLIHYVLLVVCVEGSVLCDVVCCALGLTNHVALVKAHQI
ncbi:hypothetical protein ACTAJO_004413, partial [Vibrio fluvialis]